MRDALKQRWLGVIFSVLIIMTYAVGYNMLAAYNLQDTFSAFDFYSKTTAVVIGIILAVLFVDLYLLEKNVIYVAKIKSDLKEVQL